MNRNEKMMPENCYSLDSEMSLDKIKRAKDSGHYIVANVSIYSCIDNCVYVDLGNNLKGKIPLEDFSIYPTLRSNGQISPTVYSMIGKRICACVKEICDDNTIILSRKENMLKSFKFLKNLDSDIISCSITSISKFGLFVDVGHGINGLIHVFNITASRVNDLSDIGFRTGQVINAKISSIDFEKYQVDLLFKDLYPNLSYSLSHGDMIEVLSLLPLDESNEAYFAFINYNTPALMNVPKDLKVPYGSKVVARVRYFNPKHPDKVRLEFVSFVS